MITQKNHFGRAIDGEFIGHDWLGIEQVVAALGKDHGLDTNVDRFLDGSLISLAIANCCNNNNCGILHTYVFLGKEEPVVQDPIPEIGAWVIRGIGVLVQEGEPQ